MFTGVHFGVRLTDAGKQSAKQCLLLTEAVKQLQAQLSCYATMDKLRLSWAEMQQQERAEARATSELQHQEQEHVAIMDPYM